MKIADYPVRNEPRKVLMVHPEYFKVVDVRNVHMKGNAGEVDKALALEQWNNLLNIYKDLQNRQILEEVSVLDGQPNLVDMVFCANQSFPWIDEGGRRKVVLGNMKYENRQKEVSHIRQFYKSKSYDILTLEKHLYFEGTGDYITQPNRNLIFAGHGYRSSKETRDNLADLLNVEIVPLELINPKFYHLDTCFIPLNDEFVVLCAKAFSEESLERIDALFEFTYFISEDDAANNFSLNTHCMNFGEEKVAIMPKGSSELKTILEEQNFELFEVDTSEFIKSGGSVFCMKMMYY